MQSYSHLLQTLTPKRLLEEPPIELPDELSLQSLWFNGQFGREFTTTENQSVSIRQFGFWNRTAGPDFLHVSVDIDGENFTGPIELDTHASDWIHHGHDSNPAFNDIVLHVVFNDSQPIQYSRTLNHKNIPKVVIPSAVVRDALHSPSYASATAHTGRCAHSISQLSDTSLESLMHEAARYRCRQKSSHYLRLRDAHGDEQALWISLAETLGYRPNKTAMCQLAQRLPIRYLKQHKSISTALLFGTAGFLHPDLHNQAPADSRSWIESLWETWWQHRQQHELIGKRSIQWVYSGVRPINHPQRRLATLACIAQSWKSFYQSHTQLEPLADWLEKLEDPFWNHHYTLVSKRSERRLSLIGKDRVRAFFLNHLLPAQMCEGNTQAWNNYLKIPATADSETVKRAATRILSTRSDRKKWLRFAWQHQALIQIYQDFCLEDNTDCASCPFPEQLNQSLPAN